MKPFSNSQTIRHLLKSSKSTDRQLRHLNSTLNNVYKLCNEKNLFSEKYCAETIAYLDVLNLIAHKKCLLPREGDSSQLFVKNMLQLLFESMCRYADRQREISDQKLLEERCDVTKYISMAFDHINSNIDHGFDTKLMEPEYMESRETPDKDEESEYSDNDEAINTTYEKDKIIESDLSESCASDEENDENDVTIVGRRQCGEEEEEEGEDFFGDLDNSLLLSSEISINKRKVLSLNDDLSLRASFVASTPQIVDFTTDRNEMSHFSNLTNNNPNPCKAPFLPKGDIQMSPLKISEPAYKDSLFPRRLQMSRLSLDCSRSSGSIDDANADITVVESGKSKLSFKDPPPPRITGEARAIKAEKCRQALANYEARKSQVILEDGDKTIVPSTASTKNVSKKCPRTRKTRNDTTPTAIFDNSDLSITRSNLFTSRYSLRPRNHNTTATNTTLVANESSDCSISLSAKKSKTKSKK